MQISGRLASVSALALIAGLGAVRASASFVIDPVFDSSITNDPNSAAIENSIDSVISLYESTFTDNISVKIYFQEGGGLGGSLFGYYYNNASVAMNALTADAKSADDFEGISHFNTVGYGSIAFTSADGRAMGMNTPGFLSAGAESDLDGIVTLNAGACFFNHNSPEGGKFDFFSVAAHEIDEVLGTSSGAGDWLAYTSDLFRYDGAGNRNFSGDTNTHVYFSIDGVHDIVEYNQYGRTGGDWGDWVPHNPSQTQDWSINSGITINPGESEFRLLDVVGYDRAPVPEPASMTVLGLGLLAFARRRRKS